MLEKNNREDEYGQARHFATDVNCDDTSSVDELRECTEQTRHTMNQTLNELEEKVSPAGVWERVRRMFFNGEDSEFDLERTVSRNAALFTAIGSGLVLFGAGLAVYAVSNMPRKPSLGQLNDRRPVDEFDRSPEEYSVPPHEAEPGVTPRPEFASSHKNLGDDASTEEIQRQVQEKAARETSEKMATA